MFCKKCKNNNDILFLFKNINEELNILICEKCKSENIDERNLSDKVKKELNVYRRVPISPKDIMNYDKIKFFLKKDCPFFVENMIDDNVEIGVKK